jgi:hypothetical protein
MLIHQEAPVSAVVLSCTAPLSKHACTDARTHEEITDRSISPELRCVWTNHLRCNHNNHFYHHRCRAFQVNVLDRRLAIYLYMCTSIYTVCIQVYICIVYIHVHVDGLPVSVTGKQRLTTMLAASTYLRMVKWAGGRSVGM